MLMCGIAPQTCESMNSPLETGDLPPVTVNLDASLEPVQDAVLDLRERVEDLCNQELSKITKQGPAAEVLVPILITSSFLALLSVFFQSMTRRCSPWATVSFKYWYFSCVKECKLTHFWGLFQPIVTHRKEGFSSVSLFFISFSCK